jgi:glucose/arabinose dehydrogenase
VQTGNDELNLITKGGNYGWPTIKGTQTKDGMIAPKIESGKGNAWAPSGLAYLNGNVFFAGLRGEALYQVNVENPDSLTLLTNFKNQYGRLRAVIVGPDENIYIVTSNTDGRGDKKAGDDKIIKIILPSVGTKEVQ